MFIKHLPTLFFSAVILSVVIATGSGFVISRHPITIAERPAHALTESAFFLDADVPGREFPSTSTPIVLPTSTYRLIAPPVAYLRGASSQPKLQQSDIPVRVPILMYHHIRPLHAQLNSKERYYSVTPEAFEAQMIGLVRAGYTTITPDELFQAMQYGTSTLPSKPVLITFDDGFKDQYKYAFPVMKRLGIKSTFFIVTQSHKQQGGALSLDMIKELDASGLVTIGSHTRNHAFLTSISKQKRLEEIHQSKQDLEQLLNHPVTSFAYPYGAISPLIMNDVREAGYDLGFWIQAGSLHASSGRYQLRRIRVLNREDVVPLLDGFSTSTRKGG